MKPFLAAPLAAFDDYLVWGSERDRHSSNSEVGVGD